MLNFPGGSVSKESACNVADLGSIPGSGRSSGEENDNPLQYSCLENPMEMEEAGRLQSMGFSRQVYWIRVPFPSPRDLPDPGIELKSPVL